MKSFDDAQDTPTRVSKQAVRSSDHPEILSQADADAPLRLLTLREAGDRLGYSSENVRRLAKGGEIAYVQRPGCAIRISEAALRDYLERYTCPARESRPGSPASRDDRSGTSATVATSLRRELKIARRQSDG